ncbi:hypothetical protein N7537_010363 [Penicillium hordei]|uniref:Uncharacterized protein n=1 Tax=Penicillium hordei TaxID=40994 RepID=A0AAD6GYQ6_9EURO|nr:uncharacterized protein N7537_010363 [Penicillium hordei]KAJ5593459.1 hypothetical protein N7537_010363 [Penicillium hordei]
MRCWGIIDGLWDRLNAQPILLPVAQHAGNPAHVASRLYHTRSRRVKHSDSTPLIFACLLQLLYCSRGYLPDTESSDADFAGSGISGIGTLTQPDSNVFLLTSTVTASGTREHRPTQSLVHTNSNQITTFKDTPA